MASLLTTIGRAPLEDLTFLTGSSHLGDETFASLSELATFLNSNPDKSVALVGHTDATGSLADNMALSKKRAKSVVQRLVTVYGVPANQLEAAGVGYLVPRASNLTKGGRDQNRRVEVILTSTR
jgi:OOP family OmpA-OmpF porin